MPRWFADVMYPSHICLVIFFEKYMAQRRISQLLALSHSHYKPVTSKGPLKGNVWRKKREKKEKRERLSACPSFFCLWYNRLKILWNNCFSVGKVSTSYFTKTIKKLAVRKQLCDPNPDAVILEWAGQTAGKQLSISKQAPWVKLEWCPRWLLSDFFITALAVVAHTKAGSAPCCISSHKVSKKNSGLAVPFRALGHITKITFSLVSECKWGSVLNSVYFMGLNMLPITSMFSTYMKFWVAFMKYLQCNFFLGEGVKHYVN